MLREDDSNVPLRDMTRWLVPFSLVILGIILFFALGRKNDETTAPIHLDAGSP
jgi:hypothetical protein